jgi:hypothetical protein
MNAKKEIERHRLPCGAVSVSVSGSCRRRLRDRFDTMLDKLTEETHPEGINEEILETDIVEIPEEPEVEETDDEKKERMIKEGKLKAEVKAEVQKYSDKLMGNSKMLQNRTGKIKKR